MVKTSPFGHLVLSDISVLILAKNPLVDRVRQLDTCIQQEYIKDINLRSSLLPNSFGSNISLYGVHAV